MIETIRQGLKADGIHASINKLCQWFAVPRRTVYYRPTKAAPKVDAKFAEPIKAMIEENPAFGYRTVAHLLAKEHGATDLPAERLASEEAPRGLPAAGTGVAVSRAGPERAVGDRPLSNLGRARPLDHLGTGDRLPY